jgi:hypothetical protein
MPNRIRSRLREVDVIERANLNRDIIMPLSDVVPDESLFWIGPQTSSRSNWVSVGPAGGRYFGQRIIDLYESDPIQPECSLLDANMALWSNISGRSRQRSVAAIEALHLAADLRLIEGATTGVERGTLTCTILRHLSEAAILLTAATQLIYLLTGVTVLHPVAAGLLLVVSLAFLAMSMSMRKEINRILHHPRSDE